MKNTNISIGLAIALTCALIPYTALAQSNDSNTNQQSSLTLAAHTDSLKTLGRHYEVTRYLNQTCDKPKRKARLFRKKYAKDQHIFKPIDVPDNELFLLQVDYREDRRDSERTCSSSLGFVPQPGRSYRLDYKVSGQVSRCTLELVDITNEDQPMEPQVSPASTCTKKGALGNKNGVPTHRLIDRY